MNAHSVLSVPSWVIPGTYAENLRFLEAKGEIRGVELLFFIYDDEIKRQLDSEWDEILRYAERFVFTAHLPEALQPAHGELVARLSPLVRHFIIHPEGNLGLQPRRQVPFKENPISQVSLLAGWSRQYGAKFLAENTQSGLLEALLPHLEAHPDVNFGLCMDTGHLLLEGKNPAAFLKKHRERVGEIHLHAVDRKEAALDGRLPDHRRLRRDEKWLLDLFPLIKDYGGIINLEVFSWEEAAESADALRSIY